MSLPPVYNAGIFEHNLNSVKKLGKFPSQIKIINTNCFSSFNETNSKPRARQVTDAFLPHHLVLLVFGRFPFTLNYQRPKSRISKHTVLEIFLWCYFILTSAGQLFVLFTSTLGFAHFFLYWDFIKASDDHEDELELFQSNIVPFVLFWGCLVHSTVGNFAFFFKRKKVVNYFKQWDSVVDTLKLQLPWSLQKFLIFSNLGVLIFAVAAVAVYFWDCIETVRGISNLVVQLTLRIFLPGIHEEYRIYGLIITIYVVYSSRAIIFIFTFNCRLLQHCFKVWNERLQELLLDSNENAENEFRIEMEKYHSDKFLSDHCALISMVKKTDTLFSGILQSYYLTQALNMCFELYFLAKSGSCASMEVSLGDILVPLVLIFQTFFIFFTVSLEGAYVNEEAMKGFQILRRRGVRGTDSLDKKLMIHNLTTSLSQNIVLTGGKFFSIDRPFIVRVLGAVFTYFVIILQYGSNINEGCTSQNDNDTSLCGKSKNALAESFG